MRLHDMDAICEKLLSVSDEKFLNNFKQFALEKFKIYSESLGWDHFAGQLSDDVPVAVLIDGKYIEDSDALVFCILELDPITNKACKVLDALYFTRPAGKIDEIIEVEFPVIH